MADMTATGIDSNHGSLRSVGGWQSVLIVCLVASVVLNVALALRVRDQRRAIDRVKASGVIAVGEGVPAFTAKSLSGDPVEVRYDGDSRNTVLYVFSPRCDWCDRNEPNLQEILQRSGSTHRFVAISLSEDGLHDYVLERSYQIPVVTALDEDTKARYKLGGTPQTLVISPEGRVLENWIGVYDGEVAERVEGYFDVRLPGLAKAPGMAH